MAALSAPSAIGAQPFDPASFQEAVRERPTELLVLGSPHLAQTGGNFEAAWLEPLLAELQRYRPQAIVVEALPGEALHNLVSYAELYPGVAEMFARTRLRLASQASASLGLSLPAAEAASRRTLERWPARPAPAERRRLAALFIASTDLNSALLQWLRLAPAERLARDGIDEDAAAELGRLAESSNERISIAVRLAVRLGLERIESMDDQSESDLVFSALDAVTEAEESVPLAAARSRRPSPLFTRMVSPESVLTAFREHNSPQAARLDAEHQWLARLELSEHQDVHRRRVAAWEARNLRMAANIREVSAIYPGQRILVLVGSAHKPYLEAYLRLMADVRLIPAAEVIGPAN